MATEREPLSPTQIGLGVLWPACWTGLPIKLALAVLLFAMGIMEFEGRLGIAFLMLLASPVTILAIPIIMLWFGSHFGEGSGVPILFFFSIPIDIWAFGVVGKTYLLERLRKEPPDGVGFTLWWKSAVAGALFLPIVWFIVSAVTETAVSTSHSIAQVESLRSLFDTGLPVAERIGLEVTIWGTIAFGVLIADNWGLDNRPHCMRYCRRRAEGARRLSSADCPLGSHARSQGPGIIPDGNHWYRRSHLPAVLGRAS
jgi:hypothetical protein